MLYLYGGNRELRAGLSRCVSKQLPGGPGAGWASPAIPPQGADAHRELGLEQGFPARGGGQLWSCLLKDERFLCV